VVGLGCIGLALALPCILVAQYVVQAYFHASGIFWKVDPPYLLGPIALLFCTSIVAICLPLRRVDGTSAFQPLRGFLFVLAVAAPLGVATWEFGYAFAPFRHYEAYAQVADLLAMASHAALALCCALLVETSREWELRAFPASLRWLAAAWGLTLLDGFGHRRPRLFPTWADDALGQVDEPNGLAFCVGCAATSILLLLLGLVLRSRSRSGAKRSDDRRDPILSQELPQDHAE
jgi:hypothetical protein